MANSDMFYPGGEHSTFPGNYMTMDAGGPLQIAQGLPNVRSTSAGTMVPNLPPANFTDTTDQQGEPHVPYIVSVQEDSGGRVSRYIDGEALFGLYSSTHKSYVNQAKSMWDLNFTLKKSHVKWIKKLENCTSVEQMLEVDVNDVKTSNKPRFGTDVLDGNNFLCAMSGTTINSLNRFLDVVDFLGITIDPSANHVSVADKYHKTSKVRTFVCNASGRTSMPNIFRATMPGQEVGFVVKKFTNPFAFSDESNMTWKQLLAATETLQVWPVCNGPKRLPLCGSVASDAPTLRADMDTYARQAAFSQFQRLPDGAQEFDWWERDPQKISLRYMDYEMRVHRPDNRSALVLDPCLVAKTGLYIPLGTIRSSTGQIPSVEQITAAVSPTLDTQEHALNSDWTLLKSYCQIEVSLNQNLPSLIRGRLMDLSS